MTSENLPDYTHYDAFIKTKFIKVVEFCERINMFYHKNYVFKTFKV